jgi:Heterokaryon incompatibility protein (HET)
LPPDGLAGNQQISLDLKHFPGNQNASYKAVSYQWGDPTPAKEVTVNGKPYPITINLYELLQRLQQYELQVEQHGTYF